MILAAVIFEKKKVPLSYLLLTNSTPSTYLEHCIHFNCCKCTVFYV